MTRKEELEQKANKAVDLVYGRVDRNADLDEYDRRECVANICAMFLQVEREALEWMRRMVKVMYGLPYDEHVNADYQRGYAECARLILEQLDQRRK